MMDIWPVLEESLERYKASVVTVRQCLFNYESQCVAVIDKIKKQSFDESQNLFDELYEIQNKLAMVKYKFEFPLTDRLEDFVYCLDRDDIYSRKFWYEKFKAGQEWPDA